MKAQLALTVSVVVLLAGCQTTTDGLTSSTKVGPVTVTSTPVQVSSFVVTPKTARKGETLKFSFRVENPQGIKVRWSIDMSGKVEGTSSSSSTGTITHDESASALITEYGYGSRSAHLRVYDYYYDTTYSDQTVSFTLQ